MTKFKQLTLALLLIALAMAGCKKETNPVSELKNGMSAEDIKLAGMVKSFQSRLASPLKSGEVMTVDSAVWLMKLATNYTYGDASAIKQDVSIEETNIPFDNSAGYLSTVEVGNLYDAVIDSVRTHYYSINAPEKALSYVNIVIDTIHTASAPDSYQLGVTSVVMSNGITIPWNFGPTDYWWWADGGGKCGSYSGFDGKDAMTQLEYMFQLRLPQPNNGYWVPEFTVHDVPLSFPASSNPTNVNGWYMFRNDTEISGIFHECIPYEEMNFYLDGLELVANTLLPQHQGFYGQGYYCIGVDLHSQSMQTTCGSVILTRIIQHAGYFTYGTPHYGNPGGEL